MSNSESDFDWLVDYARQEKDEEDNKSWWGGLDSDTLFGKKLSGVAASSFLASRYGETETDRIDLTDELRAIRRAANVLSNSSGEEKIIEVRWSTGDGLNQAAEPVVYLNPDVLNDSTTRKPNWSGDERKDVLIGEAYVESVMKKTVDPATEIRMGAYNTSRAGVSALERELQHRVWLAAERLYAESQVVKEYAGFKSYFAAARAYYTDDEAYKDLQENLQVTEDAVLATKALLWELMHPSNVLVYSEKMGGAIARALDRIRAADSSMERGKAAARTVEHFLELWPPPDESGSGDDEADDEDVTYPPPGGSKGGGDDGEFDRDTKKRPKSKSRAGNADKEPPKESLEAKAPEWHADKLCELRDSKSLGLPPEARDQIIKVKGWYEEIHDPGEGGTWHDLITCPEGMDFGKMVPNAETKVKYAELIGQLHPQITTLRNRLKLRAEENKLTEHGLRRGRLDEGSLHKLCFAKHGVDDPYLFEADEVLAAPSVAFLLLIDESGSMGANHRAHQARDCAIVIANAVKTLPGVDVAVMGHTGQGGYMDHSRHAKGLAMHTYFSPDQPELEAIARVRPYCQNLDGYAIGQAAEKLRMWYPHAEAHVLVHISDGEPAAGGYGGSSAMRHINRVCLKSGELGVKVVGVGIDNAFSEYVGKRMYGAGNFIVLSGSNAYHAVSNVLVNAVHRRRDPA